ncbi:hypothetical protein CAEBREN_20666 [Caenorhabditis brenneri]|uniref:Uncharacterized protein n=1 Tax=Caenorhabditis brenneri TaxID=135651 RepID=G0MF99_CAEBE|nr:hypothetical protein CAEBREN_20666 [Caenorhabditis brenneri]
MFVYILSFVGFCSFILVQINCKKKKKEVVEPVVIVAPSPQAQSLGSKLTDLNDNVQMDVTQREDETELVMEEMELEEQQKQMKNGSKGSKPSSAEKSGKKMEKSAKKAPLEIDKTQQMSEKEPEKSVEKTQNSFKGEKKENKTSQESLKFYGNSPQKNTGLKYSQDVL